MSYPIVSPVVLIPLSFLCSVRDISTPLNFLTLLFEIYFRVLEVDLYLTDLDSGADCDSITH